MIGNVAKDSVFACLQSAGAGGGCLEDLQATCDYCAGIAAGIAITQWPAGEEESSWEASRRGNTRFQGTIVCDTHGECKMIKKLF